jgi:hypothetical protein
VRRWLRREIAARTADRTGERTLPPCTLSHPARSPTLHVDVMTTPRPLGQVSDLAHRTQTFGFSGLRFTELGRTAYLNAAVASQAAPELELSTGVAVAFPRSPFVSAATAWELQEATIAPIPTRTAAGNKPGPPSVAIVKDLSAPGSTMG